LRNNLKREQLLEERYFEIDRENKILLQKMSDIMRHTSFDTKGPPKGAVSLNRDLRKTELMRITQENQAILKRIQKAQPIYNHVEWEDSYRRSATYLKNSAQVTSARGRSRDNAFAAAGAATTSGDFRASPSSASALRSSRSDGGKPRTAPGGADDDLRYVLKEGKKIGTTYYLVEMVTDGRTLAISAYDGDAQRTLELLVSEKNHRRLFRECNGDYNLVAERLRVEGNQLVLDRPGDDA